MDVGANVGVDVGANVGVDEEETRVIVMDSITDTSTDTSTLWRVCNPPPFRGRVSDPGRGTNKPARVANPQQDAGGLQTRPNVEVNVGENVDVNVDVNVVANIGVDVGANVGVDEEETRVIVMDSITDTSTDTSTDSSTLWRVCNPPPFRGRVSDPGRGTNKPARVANPQQDAGGLQTRPNMEVNVGENVDVNVDVNVVLTWM